MKEHVVIENKITELEIYFNDFKKNVIGDSATFASYYGMQQMRYADWIASGRLYEPIERIICDKVGPMMANTHSFSSESGKATTHLYQEARQVIKNHVNASKTDVLVTTGTGMTGALNKLLRILKMLPAKIYASPEDKPVVFLTHMEHHSNQVCWLETGADVVLLPLCENGLVNPEILETEIKKYSNRKILIGSFTACSNVTGIISPYHRLAKIMHDYNGYCFIDFAASAPYVTINMHPEIENEYLDAIFFSPHKFLGGPGSCGVLVYNQELHQNSIPDNPGGGNVKWTKPNGEFAYYDDLETREDGGTPGILQVIRAALAINLKEKMTVQSIQQRENELLQLFYTNIESTPEIKILGARNQEQIGCVSFNIDNIHYNLVVRLLNDRFGIQVRGGWSCASTYAHYLCAIEEANSEDIMNQIQRKDLTEKPGWVRLSLHPIMTNNEVSFIIDALKAIIKNQKTWSKDYSYNAETNEFDPIFELESDPDRYKNILNVE
ncbi:MAG: aminotransferase class V-fold PLP-dependent enzyme [Cellulophaga sp.]|nr:aminotransferase class V-fold PLP-dependent enzyme [Cellulophaga sp.]